MYTSKFCKNFFLQKFFLIYEIRICNIYQIICFAIKCITFVWIAMVYKRWNLIRLFACHWDYSHCSEKFRSMQLITLVSMKFFSFIAPFQWGKYQKLLTFFALPHCSIIRVGRSVGDLFWYSFPFLWCKEKQPL